MQLMYVVDSRPIPNVTGIHYINELEPLPFEINQTSKQAFRRLPSYILMLPPKIHKQNASHQPGNRWNAHGERVKANIAIILLMSSGL